VTRENVVDALKWHATDDQKILGLMDDLEIIGQTFYNTAVHFKTLRAIICNPPVYAQKLHVANGEGAAFKRDPLVKNLKELFIKEAVTIRTPVPTPRSHRTRRKILNELSDDFNTLDEISTSSEDDERIPSSGIITPRNVFDTPPARLSSTSRGKNPKGKRPSRKGMNAVKRNLLQEQEASCSYSEPPRKSPKKKSEEKKYSFRRTRS